MKNHKTLSLGLISIIALSSIMPAQAMEFDIQKDASGYSIEDVTYQNSEDKDFTNETSVFAEIGSEFKITIPKVIVLSGITKKANYYVKVEGDIGGEDYINVVPDDSTLLYTHGKPEQTANIAQDKTKWTLNDFDVDANGNVQADGITAGYWKGIFDFNIDFNGENMQFNKNDEYIDTEFTVATFEKLGYNAEYTNTGTMRLLKNNVEITSFEIPSEYEYENKKYKITRIGDGTFASFVNLETITIPDSVTSIGDNGFTNCTNLRSISIPDSVTSLGRLTFASCKNLESITFPKNITKISWQSFYGCEKLKLLEIPDGVTLIGEQAFDHCTNLETVILPSSVNKINGYAFNECPNLKNITIPNNVTEIKAYTFGNDTSLTLQVPNSVKTIDKNAFLNVPHVYYRGTATGSPWGAKAIN